MPPPKLHLFIASDSWGFSLHEELINHLKAKHSEDVHVTDLGVYSKYYEAAHAAGLKVELAVLEGRKDVRGILCCGSGQGMAVIANKFRHVYACLCTTTDQAKGCRVVNDSNVLTLGARVTDADTAKDIVDAWLTTSFAEDLSPHIQEFVESSMPEIDALDFSSMAKMKLADAVPPGASEAT